MNRKLEPRIVGRIKLFRSNYSWSTLAILAVLILIILVLIYFGTRGSKPSLRKFKLSSSRFETFEQTKEVISPNLRPVRMIKLTP